MKKNLLFFFLFLFVILVAGFVSADTCTDTIEINESCTVLTPNLNCTNTSMNYTYNMYSDSGSLVEQGDLQAVNSDIYSFSFNQTTSTGGYIFEICTGQTREIQVVEQGVNLMSILMTQEFFHLGIFGFFFLLGLIFIYLMHAYKEDTGSCLVYGIFGSTIFFILGGMILLGFEPIILETEFAFGLNNVLAMICLILGIYTAWYSYSLYSYINSKQNTRYFKK